MKLYYHDIIQFFRALTIRRLVNAIGLYTSYYISRWARHPVHVSQPLAFAVEPTTSCNLRCPECPSGLRSFTRPTGMLSLDTFNRVVDQFEKRAFYLTLYFQGEPYLNPNFFEMVRHAKDKKLYVATSTNAHFLDDEQARETVQSGLDRLIVSIDGTTQDSYESYRIGGQLQQVIEGTKNVVKAKKELKSRTPHIIFQFLVVRQNEHQIEALHKLAKEIGVDEVKLKTAQIYDYENGSDLIPINTKYSRYVKKDAGHYTLKNKLLNQCWKMWHSCVVTWDGNVVPCCFDKDASHPMGNLLKADLRTIWNSKKNRTFRKNILNSRSKIDICQNCTEGTKVWA